MLRRVVWGERCYLVPWDDGTLLVGATVEDAGFDERTTVAGVRDLLDAACEIVPGALDGRLSRSARGSASGRPPTCCRLSGASRVLPNLMYATGHYRNGILLAPLTAVLVADACSTIVSIRRWRRRVLQRSRDFELLGRFSRLGPMKDCDRRRSVSHRVDRTDGQWVAHAERVDTGERFGIECAGASTDEAAGRV